MKYCTHAKLEQKSAGRGNTFGGLRMALLFRSMLLSGKRVTELILEAR